MLKPDKVIKGVKSITFSDEEDNSSTHYDRVGTWSSITIKLDNGKEISIHACNFGSLHEGKKEEV